MGTSKKLKKLRKRVEELEEKVEQHEKRTNDSRLFPVIETACLLLEITVAILTILKEL